MTEWSQKQTTLSERVAELKRENERLRFECELNATPVGIIQDHARMEERAAIVAWLRSDRIVLSMDGSVEDVAASAIEAGEHMK